MILTLFFMLSEEAHLPFMFICLFIFKKNDLLFSFVLVLFKIFVCLLFFLFTLIFLTKLLTKKTCIHKTEKKTKFTSLMIYIIKSKICYVILFWNQFGTFLPLIRSKTTNFRKLIQGIISKIKTTTEKHC